MLPRIFIKDSRLRVFQYKLLNTVLHLNKILFRFTKIDSPLFSCKTIDKALFLLFYSCTKANLLWDQLKEFISNKTLSMTSLTPQSAIIVYINLSDGYLSIIESLFTNFIYITPKTEAILTPKIWNHILIKLKALRKKLANMNLTYLEYLEKDLSILRNGVTSLTTLLKPYLKRLGFLNYRV